MTEKLPILGLALTLSNRMESDINYLIARLGKIDGFGTTGDHLLNIVKSKRSAQAAVKSSAETQLERKDSNSKDPKTDGTTEEDSEKKPADNNSSN